MLAVRIDSDSQGVAMGNSRFFESEKTVARRERICAAEDEVARFNRAHRIVCAQLDDLFDDARERLGEESAAVFDILKMVLESRDYRESITDKIRGQNVSADCAVRKTAHEFWLVFSSMNDAYMKERALDVADVSERLLRVLELETVQPLRPRLRSQNPRLLTSVY